MIESIEPIRRKTTADIMLEALGTMAEHAAEAERQRDDAIALVQDWRQQYEQAAAEAANYREQLEEITKEHKILQDKIRCYIDRESKARRDDWG